MPIISFPAVHEHSPGLLVRASHARSGPLIRTLIWAHALYLGPAGQRCSRRAVEGSFCARHQPGSGQLAGLSVPQISKRAVAILGLLAVLWPVLADLVRELIRLLR